MSKRKIKLNKDIDAKNGLTKGRVMVPDTGGDYNVRRAPVRVTNTAGVSVNLDPFDFDFVDRLKEEER